VGELWWFDLSAFSSAYKWTFFKTNPKGLPFVGMFWQGCRFAPTPALPKDQA